MRRPPAYWADLDLAPLREYWRAQNRLIREAQKQRRARRKLTDQHRPKCTCPAYPWPHRPGGGLCRHPDPPLMCWQPKTRRRRYRDRYAGLRRQIARANGLHPIRDRATIDALLPRAVALAKELHQQRPTYKYRNMVITATGITGYWTTAGPTM